MKSTKLLLVLFFTLSFSYMNSQTLKEKDQERQANKVKLFSDEEFANLDIWFYTEVQKMNMSENVEMEYSSILNRNLTKMSRLDDKDKAYSTDEIIKKFNKMLKKLNADVKPVLNDEQYAQHTEIMEIVSEAILNKVKLKE